MQLVGVAALFLAAKYEEITVPAVEDLVYISAATFKESDLYQMEREIFKTIGFDISRPISLTFLRRYSKAAMVNIYIRINFKYFDRLNFYTSTGCVKLIFIISLNLIYQKSWSRMFASLNWFPMVIA